MESVSVGGGATVWGPHPGLRQPHLHAGLPGFIPGGWHGLGDLALATSAIPASVCPQDKSGPPNNHRLACLGGMVDRERSSQLLQRVGRARRIVSHCSEAAIRAYDEEALLS